MFKLAREGVYNNFPSDKYCTLQKVLQAASVRMSPVDKLEVFSQESFRDIHVFNKIVFLVYCYNPQVKSLIYKINAFLICSCLFRYIGFL